METRDRTAVIACCAAPVLLSVDFAAIGVLAPQLQVALHLSTSRVAWLVSGYSAAFGGFLLAAGAWVDAHGARRVLVAGFLAFAAGAAVVATAQSPMAAFAGRIVQGAAAAGMFAASLSALAGERGTAAFGLAVGGGFVAGALAGGAVATVVSWRAGIALSVPCCLSAAWGARRLPAGPPPAARTRPRPGAGRATVPRMVVVALGALVAGGTAGAAAAGPGYLPAALAVGGVLVFGRRRGPAVAVAAGASMALTGTMVAATLLAGLYLQDARGLTPVAAGTLLACFGAAAVPAAWLARRVAGSWRPGPLVAAGLAVQGLALAGAGASPRTDLALAAALATLGFGHVLGNAGTALVALRAGGGSAETGVLAGTLGAAQRLGGALGPLLVTGAAIDDAGFRNGMAATAAVALAVAAASWLALRHVA